MLATFCMILVVVHMSNCVRQDVIKWAPFTMCYCIKTRYKPQEKYMFIKLRDKIFTSWVF